MDALNKTFETGLILKAEDLTEIVRKINEIIDSINDLSSTPEEETTPEE